MTPEQTFPIHYRSNAASSETQFSTPAVRRTINLDKVPSAPSVLQRLPARAQQTQVVYTKIQKMARNHNIPEGYFNQTTWQPQSEPPVPLIGLPRERWDSNQFAFSTGSDAVWVDLVVNNLDEGPHPFHMVSWLYSLLSCPMETSSCFPRHLPLVSSGGWHGSIKIRPNQVLTDMQSSKARSPFLHPYRSSLILRLGLLQPIRFCLSTWPRARIPTNSRIEPEHDFHTSRPLRCRTSSILPAI